MTEPKHYRARYDSAFDPNWPAGGLVVPTPRNLLHDGFPARAAPSVRNPCATDGHYDPDNTGICILCCALLGEDVAQTQKEPGHPTKG